MRAIAAAVLVWVAVLAAPAGAAGLQVDPLPEPPPVPWTLPVPDTSILDTSIPDASIPPASVPPVPELPAERPTVAPDVAPHAPQPGSADPRTAPVPAPEPASVGGRHPATESAPAVATDAGRAQPTESRVTADGPAPVDPVSRALTVSAVTYRTPAALLVVLVLALAVLGRVTGDDVRGAARDERRFV